MEGLGNLVFLALLIGVFYFLLIRPQKRRVDQHRTLIESISAGRATICSTAGGIPEISEMSALIGSSTHPRSYCSAAAAWAWPRRPSS